VEFPGKGRRGESLMAICWGKLIVPQDLWYSVLFYNVQVIKMTTAAGKPTS